MLSHAPSHPIQQALATAALALFCQGASAAEVAPYFAQWDGPMMNARQNAGMTSAILAFAVTRGSCVLDTGFAVKLPDARNYVAAGNRLYISWGGHDGVYAEEACSDDELFSMMERVMQEAGTRRFDFDIEGHHLYDTNAHARRSRVLARLQARYPDMQVVFSLPGWLRGFSAESMNLLRTTLSQGVRIDSVIMMAQSFGVDNLRTMVSPSTVGQATIVAFRAAALQLAQLFPNRTPAQLHAMMGITPMIGSNDDGSTFTLADAQTVANFAVANSIGILSYWSFGRDRAGGSGVSQSDYQFHRTFQSASGGYVQYNPPASIPVAAPAPTTSTGSVSCSSTAWVQGGWYPANAVVSYGGRLYIATYANPGYNPTVSTYFWSAYYCSTPATPAPASATAQAWTSSQVYTTGNVVTYAGRNYVARAVNFSNIVPTDTRYWSATTTQAASCTNLPAWSTTTRYLGGIQVSRNGSVYVSTALSNSSWNVNSVPEWSPTLWTRTSC